MGRTLAVMLTAGAGVLVAMQAPINGHLGEQIGRIQAALVSFLIGTALLLLITYVYAGGFPEGVGIGRVSWQYFLGGVLGAAYVTTVIFTVKTLGAGGVTAATITGQLLAAVLLDHFGAFGLERHQLNWQRVLGVCLLAAGTYLVVAGRKWTSAGAVFVAALVEFGCRRIEGRRCEQIGARRRAVSVRSGSIRNRLDKRLWPVAARSPRGSRR